MNGRNSHRSRCVCSVFQGEREAHRACHPSNPSQPCSANIAQGRHLRWCGFQRNSHCTSFLYPLQSQLKSPLSSSSYSRPFLNTCALLNTLKEAGWGRIIPSHASYRRSLEATHNASGGRAGEHWRWQQRSLEKLLQSNITAGSDQNFKRHPVLKE